MKKRPAPTTPPQHPGPAAIRKSRALELAHNEWAEAHADADVPFRPDAPERRTPSDYNLHYLDVEATPAMDADLDRRYREHLARLEAEDEAARN
ncbi:hypothetical protein [Streptomyces sp. NPDC005953]|uniref:hypothetical protein n=1 Tax=Streptomyces sp. NPDC005953 TaxID=3156719 RepID=UPI003403D487